MQLSGRLKRFLGTIVGRLAVFLVVACSWCGVRSYAQLNTDAVLTIGRSALYYEDYALSIQYFNQIISARPNLYVPYYYRAIAKYYLGDYLGAIEDCSMSVERDSYIPEVYRLRAINYIRTEDYDHASADYYYLIRNLKVRDRDVWYNLVLCKSQLKENDEADSLLDSMAVSWPDYARIYMLKAQIALTRSDTLSADTLLRHTIALDSTDVDAVSALGLVSLQRGLNAEAEAWYSKAIAMSPRRTGFYVNRALSRYQQTNLRGAMADYNAAIETNPNNYLAHYNRALLRMQVAENNLAIEDFDFVLNRHPNDRLALYNRAILAQQTGDFSRAIRDYTTIIKEFPGFQSAYVNRAYCYGKVGDRRRSDADNRKAMQLQLDYVYTRKEAKSPLDAVTRDKSDVDIEDYDKLVTDESDNMVPTYASQSRGAIQNKQVEVEYQPICSLTFFEADNGLSNTKTEQPAFVEYINATKIFDESLSLSPRELPLTDSQCEIVAKRRAKVEELLKTSPDSLWLHFAEAVYLTTERNYDLALKELNACEALMSGTQCPVGLAMGVYSLRSMVKSKIVDLRVMKKDGNSPADGRMKYAGAIADLSSALRLDAECAPLYYNRATLYALGGDYSKAIDDFNVALQHNPLLAEAYYNRGLAYVYSGDPQKGLADFSKAGELGLYTAYSLIKHFAKK